VAGDPARAGQDPGRLAGLAGQRPVAGPHLHLAPLVFLLPARRGDAILPDEPGWTLAVVFGIPSAWLLLLGLVALLRSDRRSVPDLLAGTRVEVDAGLHSSGSTGKES
jgi:hypothetical protein